jgi:hypothetical protein
MSKIFRGRKICLDQIATWILEQSAAIVHQHLAQVRSTPSWYYEYIEGMLADYAETLNQWRTQHSSLLILLKSIPWGFTILIGISKLTVNRFFFPFNLFYQSAQLVHVLTISSVLALPSDYLAVYISGNTRRNADTITLRLSPTCQITGWGEDAERVLGFVASEVLGQNAIDTFIPSFDLDGRCQQQLIIDVCRMPEKFGLNLNENVTRSGERFSAFWMNIPLYDGRGNLSEIFCIGYITDVPGFMTRLIFLWRIWVTIRPNPQ